MGINHSGFYLLLVLQTGTENFLVYHKYYAIDRLNETIWIRILDICEEMTKEWGLCLWFLVKFVIENKHKHTENPIDHNINKYESLLNSHHRRLITQTNGIYELTSCSGVFHWTVDEQEKGYRMEVYRLVNEIYWYGNANDPNCSIHIENIHCAAMQHFQNGIFFSKIWIAID